MTMPAGFDKKLSIKRHLELPGAIVTIDCSPGTITILNDENGGSLPKYCRALSSGTREERFSVQLGTQEYRSSDHTLIGFEGDLPDGVSISEHLSGCGFTHSEIEKVIDAYDLRSIHYLHCAQLPETAKRQVQLLVALRTTTPVLILNDPFLPFNGRWREAFAALLIEHIVSTKRICVITNLSFAPKCWLENSNILTCDVGTMAERILKKTQEQILKMEAEKERNAKTNRTVVSDGDPNVSDELSREVDELTGLPRIAWYAYCETKDFIFDPLARITKLFRSFGGSAVIAGFAFLVLVMGFVMFPQLAKQRALIRELASKIDVSWGDVKNAITQPDQNSQEVKPAQPPAEGPASLVPAVDDTPQETAFDEDGSDDFLLYDQQPQVVLPSLDFVQPTLLNPVDQNSSSLLGSGFQPRLGLGKNLWCLQEQESYSLEGEILAYLLSTERPVNDDSLASSLVPEKNN